MSEEVVARLFENGVECSKLAHAVHWVSEHRPDPCERWPSRRRVVNGVKARWNLRISDRVAREAIDAARAKANEVW